MKKVLGFILIGALFASTTAFATDLFSFSDQDNFAGWYRSSVMKLHDLGIMNGYPDGSFKPENQVNRAELATVLDKYDEYQVEKTDDALINAFLMFMRAQKTVETVKDITEENKYVITLAIMRLRCKGERPTGITLDLVKKIPIDSSSYDVYREANDAGYPRYVNYFTDGATIDIGGGKTTELDGFEQWCGPY